MRLIAACVNPGAGKYLSRAHAQTMTEMLSGSDLRSAPSMVVIASRIRLYK